MSLGDYPRNPLKNDVVVVEVKPMLLVMLMEMVLVKEMTKWSWRDYE